jgi:UDP-GlcNAc3NAcA epimerase
MKVVTIVGARPQFVKAAVVSRAIERYNSESTGGPEVNEVIVHTGQHYDTNMSDIFFTEMKIPTPDFYLGIGGTRQGAMTGWMLEKIEEVLLAEKPDTVLVYGDTNSTLAGALAGVKLHIPVAHVEAGLRSFNMLMPEEINRILTDRISRWLFCPTETASDNLLREGISTGIKRDIIVSNVGDVMYDALLCYKNISKPTVQITKLINDLREGFYLATVHRAENTDDAQRLRSILSSLQTIARRIPVVLPLHPRTRNAVNNQGWSFPDINFIEPVGYFDMLTLLEKCNGVFTDSGGLQKEAYFMHKQCVTLRDETEWVELLATGNNRLAGADYDRIIAAEAEIMTKQPGDFPALYGDGHAGEKIVKHLAAAFA